MNIFLLDSNVLFRQGLTSMLDSQADLKVIGETGSVSDAIEKVVTLQPDLVLMDVILPDGNGLDVLQIVGPQLTATKFVILTVYDTDDLLFTAIRLGAKGYLLKNTPFSKLAAAIRGVERGEAALSRSMTGRLLEEFSRSTYEPGVIDQKLACLTLREREILGLLGNGAANREIARHLSISENTVKIHVHNILDKLNAANRVEAGRLARYLQVDKLIL